ncbi:MAG: serine hydrolase domain-containing protein, partial [Burkholderiaceae bacterium]
MMELSATTSASPEAAGLHAPAVARVRAMLNGLIAEHRLPGAVALVMRRGALGWFEALGMQDAAHGTAMRRDAIFRIYSMTKPIVSVAVMQLFEQGRVRLGDPVARHLPEFAHTPLGIEIDGRLQLVAPPRAMTVHDLLRNTAGLTYEFLPPSAVRKAYVEEKIASRQRSNAEFCATLAHLPLMHSPGSIWEYSRATDVLGRLV